MPAMQAAKGRFKTELHPGEGAVQTGETIPWTAWNGEQIRVPVYQRRDQQTRVAPKKNPATGEPMFKYGPDKQPIGFETQLTLIGKLDDPYLTDPKKIPGFVAYELDKTGEGHDVVMLVREFIPVDIGNGSVEMNFNFRPSKAEAERRVAQEKRERAFEKLGGFTDAQIERLAELLGDDEE